MLEAVREKATGGILVDGVVLEREYQWVQGGIISVLAKSSSN